jgi:hypothetical protein
MCRQLILLAKNDFRQMIFMCEHGTLHISHQHTTVCLSRSGFQQLAPWIMAGNWQALEQSGAGSLHTAEDGWIELWLGSGGWRMRMLELLAFAELLRITLERLPRGQSQDLPLAVHPNIKPSLN